MGSAGPRKDRGKSSWSVTDRKADADDPPGPSPFTVLPCGTTALAAATCHSVVWLEKTYSLAHGLSNLDHRACFPTIPDQASPAFVKGHIVHILGFVVRQAATALLSSALAAQAPWTAGKRMDEAKFQGNFL